MALEIKKTKKEIGDVFGMNYKEAKLLDKLIKKHDLKNLLELGFAHGVSSCYMASSLKDNGGGHLTTIDLIGAKDHRHPNIEELLEKVNLTEYVTPYFENTSYTWRLMKFIEENDEPIFDFCYIDGAHDWYNDGFAFLLVDKLLKPGGWIVFDDLNWTFASSPSLKDSDYVKRMSDDEKNTPQIKKVFDLLVRTNENYHNFDVINNGWWGIAQKKNKKSFLDRFK